MNVAKLKRGAALAALTFLAGTPVALVPFAVEWANRTPDRYPYECTPTLTMRLFCTLGPFSTYRSKGCLSGYEGRACWTK